MKYLHLICTLSNSLFQKIIILHLVTLKFDNSLISLQMGLLGYNRVVVINLCCRFFGVCNQVRGMEYTITCIIEVLKQYNRNKNTIHYTLHTKNYSEQHDLTK